MQTTKLLFALIFVLALPGCQSFKKGSDNSNATRTIPGYVAISPISLPPVAAQVKSGLLDIALRSEGAEVPPYDLDLLVLPASMSKAQYEFFSIESNGSAAGVVAVSGAGKSGKTVYDIMHMATYPLEVALRDDVPKPGGTPGAQVEAVKTIVVTPYVGVGVRVIAEYQNASGTGNLTLPALAAELKASEGRGSIEIHQLGISRYGSGNQALAGIELTPSGLDIAMRAISNMLGQVWLQDTRVQPMIVGYSVVAVERLDAKYHPQIVDEIVRRREEILQPFLESMLHEAKDVMKLGAKPKAKNTSDQQSLENAVKAINDLVAGNGQVASVKSELSLQQGQSPRKVTTSEVRKALDSELGDVTKAVQKLTKDLKPQTK